MKLLILDRDGVINHDSPTYIKSPDEWTPIAGSLEAIARFSNAGYQVVVATNQSGIGRGLFDLETLGNIHAKMHTATQAAGGRIDAVFFCPHRDSANCDCRKPKPGLLIDILERTGVQASEAMIVGDSLRDMQAGHAVGIKNILVLTGNGRETMDHPELPPDVSIRIDLAAVANEMLG